MASIAYITDQNMIEFHRLNGNRMINFWKPSNTKKISNLKHGDFFFFLAKGTEKGKKKEKGIIGYGKFMKSYTLTFSQMWKRYDILNGYPTKGSLSEAITKITKNHKIPEYLHCLLLDQVVFFQAPIYLSDLGIDISNRIESYIYLDKDDMMTTSRILEEASKVGIDAWSSMLQIQDESELKKDAKINAVHNIYEKLKCDFYSSYDEKRIYEFAQFCIKDLNHAYMIKNSKTEFLQIRKDHVILYLPCIVNTLNFQRKIQYVIGHYKMYFAYLKKGNCENVKVCIIFDQEISDEWKEVLDINEIEYIEKLVNE